ncbi:MAG: response regulator [Candidatus Omnitrophica bacterium]|jgi:DNA-binding response OmpR family regulator|nr:response regulator [Candidatus Omnitrophota bacterium]
MKILVADDNQEAAELIQKRMIRKGHSADIAFDGRKALDLIKVNDYDLAFLDHDMPEITGLELIKYIKENGLKAKTVMITGYPAIEGFAAHDFGADEYLVKPIDLADIEALIEKYKNPS